MSLQSCPNCDSEDVEIHFNHKRRIHTLTCYACNKYYKINYTILTPQCPECDSKNIIFEDQEIFCLDCGLVLSAKPPSYVANKEIIYPWGVMI